MSSISRQNILPTKKKHGNSSWPNQALQKEPKFTRASEVQTQHSVAHAPREQASVALIRSQALPGPAHRTTHPCITRRHLAGAPPLASISFAGAIPHLSSMRHRWWHNLKRRRIGGAFRALRRITRPPPVRFLWTHWP